MSAWRIIFGLVASVAAAPRGLAQVDDAAPRAGESAYEALLDRLGEPPRADVVNLLVHDARVADPATALALAVELAQRPGYAVEPGLLVLARHGDVAVRAAALRGVAEVALRSEDAAIGVRAAIRDGNADVRTAAFQALGRIGDASDLPLLLDALGSDDERTRSAALRAITTLTGINPSFTDATRWSEWWTQACAALPQRLAAAIRTIDAGGEKADLRDARAFLSQYAWVDVERVKDAVSVWVRAVDPRHRSEGYRAAARCRLGDLAEEIGRAARDEVDPDVTATAWRSAKLLGIAPDGVAPSTAVGDLVALLDPTDDGDGFPEAEESAEALEARLARRMVELERERQLAQTAGPGPAASPGAGGGSVSSDRDGRRAPPLAAPAASPSRLRRVAPPQLGPWASVGFQLVALTLVLAAVFYRRFRRRDEFLASEAPERRATGAVDAAESTPAESVAPGRLRVEPQPKRRAAVRAVDAERFVASSKDD
jgi:HEAT repeat protein